MKFTVKYNPEFYNDLAKLLTGTMKFKPAWADCY